MKHPHSRSNTLVRALGVAIGLTVSHLPFAGAQQPAASGDSQWGLGIGVGFERKPYRDFDDKARALPLVIYENRWVSLFGPRLDLKLPSAGPVSFGLRARYFDDGYEADDSPFLTGMNERKASFWLGGTATWRTGIADLSAELLGDASGKSKGTLATLQLERRFQSGAFDITPRIAATWTDDKYVDYYYGVESNEVRAGRPSYAGDSTVNVLMGLRAGYAIDLRQNVFVDVSTTRLGSAIDDSPLVDRSTSSAVRVGYLYRF